MFTLSINSTLPDCTVIINTIIFLLLALLALSFIRQYKNINDKKVKETDIDYHYRVLKSTHDLLISKLERQLNNPANKFNAFNYSIFYQGAIDDSIYRAKHNIKEAKESNNITSEQFWEDVLYQLNNLQSNDNI